MQNLLVLTILLLTSFGLQGQTSVKNATENIVPNPSFEKYASAPIGWFYKGSHYTRVMKYWNAPTGASPDVFGPRVRVPRQWKEKGFGERKARTGVSMTGLTMYGCEDGKPHCREYVQIQLAEALVPNQEYYAEVWVSPLPRSIRIDNIGMSFTVKENKRLAAEPLTLKPQVVAKQIVNSNGWIKVFGSFKATEASNYLTIGNFATDEATRTSPAPTNGLPYAYYYIDDVKVIKKLPIIGVPVEKDDLCCIEVQKGETIRLKNIFFDSSKSELLPRSFVELKKLLALMERNPTMKIQVIGYTDNQGDDAYNLSLSTDRAASVAKYLNDNGIAIHRTSFKGFGSQQPIADNSTEEGRRMNRRVEFVVLEK